MTGNANTDGRWYPTVAALLASATGTDLACVKRTGREPGHELCAEDELLHLASAGNGNIHGVTSLIETDPATGKRVPILRLRPGTAARVDLGGWHIPAVYRSTLTCGPEQVTHGVALGLPHDPHEVGVIFHLGGEKLTVDEVADDLAEMVAGGMARRSVTDYAFRLDVATSLPDPDHPYLWRGAGAMLLFLSAPFLGKFGDAAEPLP